MKSMIVINNFDDDANSVVNRAIDLANARKDSSISSIHLASSIVSFDIVKDNIKSTVGNGVYFRVIELINGELLRESGTGSEELTINSGSEGFRTVIGNAIRIANQLDGIVSVDILLRVIINNPETEFYKLMSRNGLADTLCEKFDMSFLDTVNISKYGVSLNRLANMKKLDPISARDDIVDTMIEVLGRRNKGNPCLIGDAGVGKTAIVEGLAQRIESGDVPFYLKDKKIISIDMSAVVAGSKYRGQFEERFNSILNEAAADGNIILFFDEFHLLANAGSGSSDNPMNASNIIKPALARGDVRIIGATTVNEYKRFVETDSALERRLQSVMVNEPNMAQAVEMIKAVRQLYCQYHNVTIGNAVIKKAVMLSMKYIQDKKLPDKAITLIDETAAHVKAKNDGKFTNITVGDLRDTVSRITGIDARDVDESDSAKLMKLEKTLSKSLIGQKDAIKCVSKAIKRNKAGIRNPNKPVASLMFVGPTGVGKTELCKVLANEMYNGESNIVRLDMSEFTEKYSVSRLIGSPPGYVGYENGGMLTDAIKHKPYTIVLVDEVEKAHPDVLNVFLQIMDDGRLTDSHGVTVDFRHVMVIMTSNVGCSAKSNACNIGFDKSEVADDNQKVIHKELESVFKPEFLNRLDDIIVFNSLTEQDLFEIARLMIKDVIKHAKESDYRVSVTDDAVKFICKGVDGSKYGARNMRRKIQDTLENYLSDLIIESKISHKDNVTVDIHNDKLSYRIG